MSSSASPSLSLSASASASTSPSLSPSSSVSPSRSPSASASPSVAPAGCVLHQISVELPRDPGSGQVSTQDLGNLFLSIGSSTVIASTLVVDARGSLVKILVVTRQ